MDNFWQKLPAPAFTLAPMEDVTDTVFREIVLSVSEPGALNVLFSEFTSVDGMLHEIGGPKVSHRLYISPSEKEWLKKLNVRLVAQIWGSDPEKFVRVARQISDEGIFDGIDINMGCPVKKIIKQGACSALIGQPELAREIIVATRENSAVPVSVKTRIGINKVVTEEWVGVLLEAQPAMITIHGRIQKQQSEGMADWNEIARAVRLRDQIAPGIPVHGNGDVMSFAEGIEKAKTYGVDGVMIGRGIFANPWFFNRKSVDPTPEEKLALLYKHAQLFTQTWKETKNFAILKRFFKIYTSGFPGAAKIRARLMETSSLEEVRVVLSDSGYRVEGIS